MNDIEKIKSEAKDLLYHHFKAFALKKNVEDSLSLVEHVEPGQLMMGYIVYTLEPVRVHIYLITGTQGAIDPQFAQAELASTKCLEPNLFMVIGQADRALMGRDSIKLLINGKVLILSHVNHNKNRIKLFIVKK